jgi:hypothetical protein
VDRDDRRDNPPPGELSSFDVSKRGGREIAAELAARMAHWRSARKRPDAPARGPPASAATADPAAAAPPGAPPPNADRPSLPTGLDEDRAARIHRALRIALQARAPQTEDIRTRPVSQTRTHGAAFKTVLAGGSNTNATGEGPERRRAGSQETGSAGRARRAALGTHEALRRTRAFTAAAQAAGVTAWRALKAALAQGIDAVHRRLRAIALAADRTGLAAVRSLRRALRNRLEKAPLDARALKSAAQPVDIAGWRAPRLGHRIDHALRHARAIGAAAWHAKRGRIAIAGAAAIAVAIAAWFLVPPDRPASPDAPRQPEVASPRDDVAAPAVHPPEPPQAIAAASTPAPQAVAAASAPPQERPPDTASARLLARLKPVLQAPALATRLKPPAPETPAAEPMDPAPPVGQAQESSQSQETADPPQERGDPRAVDSMVSDGHGLSRRDHSSASATLLR